MVSKVCEGAKRTVRTGCSVVMSRGLASLSWPSSLAHVSPQQQAK